jgi:hypothetical protein
MERVFRNFLTLILLVHFFVIAGPSHADGPPPPPPGGLHGGSGNQPPGGGAPVGEGAALLVLLGAGYSIERLLTLRRKSGNQNKQEHLFD